MAEELSDHFDGESNGTNGTAVKKGRGPKAAGGTRHKGNVSGKHLVIVESPAKAKTINRYLGSDFIVEASVGHVRDLPEKAPKGNKQPVPGVDLENDFEPTYQVLEGKKKVVSDLKRLAKQASDVWFATDLDREGEAIAWHLAQELGIEPKDAKRVTFDAITKTEIEKAFSNPRPISEDLVNAQQARRILDRIVGYQVSPLLWKKVARGLSAGRVQSVAVRLVVEREREIRNFVPDEYWTVNVRITPEMAKAAELARSWKTYLAARDEKDRAPTLKAQSAWMAEHNALNAELVEINGEKFELGCKSTDPRDLSAQAKSVAEAAGLKNVRIISAEDEKGKGPAQWKREVQAELDSNTRYKVKSVQTKRVNSRPTAPFITSTLQMAAASFLGFSAVRTMRTAQSLYEGVDIPGEGHVGLITYMRTDSTHLSGEAINQARSYIGKTFGKNYLPPHANVFHSSNKAAQEAHEAIRPTDVSRTPDSLRGKLTDDQHRLYTVIWNRFVSCQMVPAEWDSTAVLFERSDKPTGAVIKATGRVLKFDGFYRVAGVPTAAEEQTLPDMKELQELAAFSVETAQQFTSPPSRYSEAGLIKMLEAEGIGRPSTYASIIKVIQDRQYVVQDDRRFYATDLGEVVTDMLMQGFPQLMDLGYTRDMEGQLDQVAAQHTDWVQMLHKFYGPFQSALEHAHETMTHAKAETKPAPYKCPKCGSRTGYRFGKNGRFLSCMRYPDCDYAAPINREGEPMLPERVNIASPEDGSPMILRTGRFGKFLASVNYPQSKFVINLDKKEQIKYPAPPPLLTDLKCEKCDAPLNLRRGKRGPWLGCSRFPKCKGRMAWTKVDPARQKELDAALEEHEKQHPQIVIRTLDGKVIPDATPVRDLLLPGNVQTLEIHPDALREMQASRKNGTGNTVK
ncbi:MAG TPA: type I DNA topoisomerase [Phycisphaerales bacterium]|nr:type I DNA topoisomerase [Phycisphaerales bacterium]